MSALDYVWRYDRIILPVVAFAVGFFVAHSGFNPQQASVLESTNQQTADFEQAYQEEIAELNDSLSAREEDVDSLETENDNLSEIITQFSEDTDGDGLADYVEEILGTDEDNVDTDGDGFNDLEEIQNGYSPLAKPTTAPTSTANSETTSDQSVTITDTPPVNSINGEECLIKGAASGTYYLPGRPDYDDVADIDKWFCSVEQALEEGFRPPLR